MGQLRGSEGQRVPLRTEIFEPNYPQIPPPLRATPSVVFTGAGAVRVHKGRLPRRALRQGQHAGPHAAQPVGWARAGCRGPP
eukprot:4658082-Prymnesium_polylepis.1